MSVSVNTQQPTLHTLHCCSVDGKFYISLMKRDFRKFTSFANIALAGHYGKSQFIGFTEAFIHHEKSALDGNNTK